MAHSIPHEMQSIIHVYRLRWLYNHLPDNKTLPYSKFKAFADNNLTGVQMLQFFCDRVENIMGKGGNAGKCGQITSDVLIQFDP